MSYNQIKRFKCGRLLIRNIPISSRHWRQQLTMPKITNENMELVSRPATQFWLNDLTYIAILMERLQKTQ